MFPRPNVTASMSAAVSDGHSSEPAPKKKVGMSHARGTDGKIFTYFSPKRLLSLMPRPGARGLANMISQEMASCIVPLFPLTGWCVSATIRHP
jgi:hypothetical protein